MPRPEADANADWMRMRFSCSLDKHGNCEVECVSLFCYTLYTILMFVSTMTNSPMGWAGMYYNCTVFMWTGWSLTNRLNVNGMPDEWQVMFIHLGDTYLKSWMTKFFEDFFSIR